jgi:hypothetical protein
MKLNNPTHLNSFIYPNPLNRAGPIHSSKDKSDNSIMDGSQPPIYILEFNILGHLKS